MKQYSIKKGPGTWYQVLEYSTRYENETMLRRPTTYLVPVERYLYGLTVPGTWYLLLVSYSTKAEPMIIL